MKYENVQIGDEFIISHKYSQKITKVSWVSPKQFIVDGVTFAKSDGYQVGGDIWSRASIQLCTDENKSIFRQKYLKLNLVRELEQTRFKELPLGTLEKIKSILDNKDNR